MTIIWSRTNSKNAAASIEAVERALADARKLNDLSAEDLLGDPYLKEQVQSLRNEWAIDMAATHPGGDGALGKLVSTFRSLVRRATWWYQLPQWQQVHQFHGTSVRVVDSLLGGMGLMRQRILLLEEKAVKLKSLEEQLGIAYERQRVLMEEVSRLRNEVQELKQQIETKS